MTRKEATELILDAKQQRGLSFEDRASRGRHKVWTTAALMGQATMSRKRATRCQCLDWARKWPRPAAMPMKGSLDAAVPVDPLIYRFHEITQVYGTRSRR